MKAKTRANVGLTEEQVASVVALLNSALADEYVLYTKTRNYHWNVTGAHFHHLHAFFESQYDAIDEKIDQIAEFVRYFGEKVPASLATFQKNARIADDASAPAAEKMIGNLLADHEALLRNLRKDVAAAGDKHGAADVADFLTGLLEDHEKMAWMLRAMLE